jgi:acyl carrier protein phosphodiesterase
MNILAHIFLSGASEKIKVGNFIGDYVKGHDYMYYPDEIKLGILIHRDIDNFTDHHTIVKKSKVRFYDDFHKYAGILVDMIYDHYLAINWSSYSDNSLDDEIKSIYSVLKRHSRLLPANVQEFIPRFIEKDWLSYYSDLEGLGYIFKSYSNVTSLPKITDKAITIINHHYSDFAEEFNEYFPLLIHFVEKKYGLTLKRI